MEPQQQQQLLQVASPACGSRLSQTEPRVCSRCWENIGRSLMTCFYWIRAALLRLAASWEDCWLHTPPPPPPPRRRCPGTPTGCSCSKEVKGRGPSREWVGGGFLSRVVLLLLWLMTGNEVKVVSFKMWLQQKIDWLIYFFNSYKPCIFFFFF